MRIALTNATATNEDALHQMPSRRKRLEYAIAAVTLVAIGHLLLGSYNGYRHRFTCVVCRLERADYRSRLRSSASTYNETSCSKWYQSHVEGSHDHVWSPSATMALVNFYGQTIGVGDNFDLPGRAVWKLTPDQQRSIYEHFSNPLDAQVLFVSLTDDAVMKDRTDYRIVDSLRAWMESGFAGSWRHPTRPVPE
ncbi:MAG: hypothetical protein R3C19_08520 [Planctomycetaceae bacterium]